MTSGTVLVTGGTGTLGRAVVERLSGLGLPSRVLSRSARGPDASAVRGDLGTGAGLAAAVEGTRAVIHCASDPLRARSVDVEGTRRLLEVIAAEAPQAHLVYISIVGAQRNPFAYYRAKADAERIVAGARTPTSVVRATQFHQLVRLLSRVPPRGPVAVTFRGMRMQPCDTSYVAEHLVDVALGDPLPHPREVAGPQCDGMPAFIALTAAHESRRGPHVLTLPAVGRALRGFAAGSNLPGDGAQLGGRRYAEWLADRAH